MRRADGPVGDDVEEDLALCSKEQPTGVKCRGDPLTIDVSACIESFPVYGFAGCTRPFVPIVPTQIGSRVCAMEQYGMSRLTDMTGSESI